SRECCAVASHYPHWGIRWSAVGIKKDTGFSPHIPSWGGHWSPGGAPGGSASAHRTATVARAGANARPSAAGSGPGLPTCEQQVVAGIDRQQSTERHHGQENNQCFRHQLLTLHHLHGCILSLIFSSFSARREPLPAGG